MSTASFSIHRAAREGGSGLALVAGGREWSWADLAEQTQLEIVRLRDAGLSPAVSSVAFDAFPTAGTVIRLLALMELGVTAVPLHPRLATTGRALRLSALDACLDLDSLSMVEGGQALWSRSPGQVEESPGLAVLFTSGSTGTPTAVELSHAAFEASAAASAARLAWRSDDRWLCCLPLAHVGGLSILTRCLLARRPIVLAGGFEVDEILQSINRDGVTLASFVPAMLDRLFDEAPDWRSPERLRAVLIGGAAAGDRLWDEIDRRGLPALATYGMTEMCSQIATATFEAPRRLRPLDGAEVRVVDGRIEVAGPMMCTRLGSGPIDESPWTADGFLRTGDLGSMSEGTIKVTGRADETIVTGGENVAPGEVEAVLEAHPAIRRAVVFGVPDPKWGQVVALAFEAEGAGPSSSELRAWMVPRLASFARPRRVIRLDRLPETPTGKPDRGSLRADFAATLDVL